MRHNVLQCASQQCAFVHCCPVPKPGGTVCGSTDHKAIRCPHRSRPVTGWGELPAPQTATGVGRPLPKPNHISGITEERQQLSRPAKTQRTDPTISFDRKSGPTTTVKSRNKALCSNHQCTSTFQVLLGYLCSPHCTFVSRGHQSWLAVLVLLDADSLLGGEAHDLTDPNVVDHVLQSACQARLASLREHSPRSDQ